MTVEFQEMVSLFKKQLELCKLKRSETMAVLTSGEIRADYAKAFLTAASEIGANAFELKLPPAKQGASGSFGITPLTDNRVAVECLKKADLVIDLVLLLFSKEQLELQDAGVRILLVVEPFDVIKRMFPKESDKERVLYATQLLRNAKELRFTNKAGSDVTYQLGQYPILTEYGFADEPGRWDHLPSCFSAATSNDGGVDGVVVLDKGDIFFPFNRYFQDQVKLTIKGGFVTDIEGGFDAMLMRDYIESFNDPRAYAISHIGWGLNERAQWHSLAFDDQVFGMDGRAFYGNVLFSLGPNSELGGNNDTPCHLDLPMKNCTLYLDGKLIVKDGDIVIDEMKAVKPQLA
ncbi:2,5-dihydroxypyridine 5,6-dioxygenase [Neobacillus bataviensis]|jgi:2,5-dihydroxypyridine 5,6-dioxygenase|uniref:2,5-dihydroxypyridine 5,6-dioxygenase n=1 Tax=Neobacillus bataviensis TaxID=220685 RepID=A0A561DNX3_9BACI|nr:MULTISPECIES: leucyl aminopeptidase [Neobacillus]MCM3726525.1 leucyl aminopeptidase [Neobacillus cucumis]TWE05063.1 2,5-dihydroxypyridine 5,6-dioxygenase [Neobacillus bataviensis]